MKSDIRYCCSSFLMYRMIEDPEKCFSEKYQPYFPDLNFPRTEITNSDELLIALRQQMEMATADGKSALALSGGIDSAILARFMPEGSTAYTFKCVVPGMEVTDETQTARRYAEACGLEHKIVEIFWEDFEEFSPLLMKHKGAPVHSIEIQIYKAALAAKAAGFERMIYGESADCIFGGQNDILSKDRTVGEFIERYAYLMPYKVLKESELIVEPIARHAGKGYVDPHEFMSTEYLPESVGSYFNASETAGIGLCVPYTHCKMAVPIDYSRIRKGENKYLVREAFKKLYPDFEIPAKTPMPRPMDDWLRDWNGPKRKEFWPDCVAGGGNLTGDQKWLIWILEKFLEMIDVDEV